HSKHQKWLRSTAGENGGTTRRRRATSRESESLPLPQKRLDRFVNPVLVLDLGQDQILPVAADFLQLAEIIAGAVRAFDLAVAEQIADRQEELLQGLQAVRVVLAPVVAVGELEDVDVPVARREISLDDELRLHVGRRNPRAARFAGAVE